MAAKKKCELWVGTSTRFFKLANFDSITDARKYVRECISCYYEIRPIEKTLSEIRESQLNKLGI